MELLLHYIWKHRIYPLHEMRTNKGELIDVIDPGLHNSNAGPDFFNAKIKIDGMLWVGNIEIHDKASDWFLHGQGLSLRQRNSSCRWQRRYARRNEQRGDCTTDADGHSRLCFKKLRHATTGRQIPSLP